MKWDDIGEQPCSIARALSVIGDRWTLLILRNAFFGMRRFESFQQNLGLSRHVLSDRLKRLVENGILEKIPYVERQERYEYRLTAKGLEIYPILMTMVHWADQWMNEGPAQPMKYIHKTCNYKITPRLICSECNETIHAKHTKAELTPDYFNYLQQRKTSS